uniref:Uncharacterized protein n=1 Tax=Chromera velia CCMP2878 TaxID=1169474 RepID=A0A0G4HAZ1_9ALVE|eukprot:Cvel_25852.t1-p1 / transcript=Cvel_25852.t1 / gene=Cvel_25852 / organism=Chromera_velia_CCMP2878 / gene_product=hypothetical protein / transcript_product=hypothetical protein / location=Cvel_scaffold2981:3194-3763(-) / protein_length=190 / sequence_SO=supercontig / SO=protein_coding / is_pseudo=false
MPKNMTCIIPENYQIAELFPHYLSEKVGGKGRPINFESIEDTEDLRVVWDHILNSLQKRREEAVANQKADVANALAVEIDPGRRLKRFMKDMESQFCAMTAIPKPVSSGPLTPAQVAVQDAAKQREKATTKRGVAVLGRALHDAANGVSPLRVVHASDLFPYVIWDSLERQTNTEKEVKGLREEVAALQI